MKDEPVIPLVVVGHGRLEVEGAWELERGLPKIIKDQNLPARKFCTTPIFPSIHHPLLTKR